MVRCSAGMGQLLDGPHHQPKESLGLGCRRKVGKGQWSVGGPGQVMVPMGPKQAVLAAP